MPFFDDFAGALGSYIMDSVNLSIVDVIPAAGDSINENEICAFQARVSNDGHVDMTSVNLEILGQNGARVGRSEDGPWLDSITVNGLTVDARVSQDTQTLFFKAPPNDGFTTLVSVRITGWNAGLTHLLVAHSDGAEKFGHLNAMVNPQ